MEKKILVRKDTNSNIEYTVVWEDDTGAVLEYPTISGETKIRNWFSTRELKFFGEKKPVIKHGVRVFVLRQKGTGHVEICIRSLKFDMNQPPWDGWEVLHKGEIHYNSSDITNGSFTVRQ